MRRAFRCFAVGSLLAGLVLAGCGHYGEPVRHKQEARSTMQPVSPVSAGEAERTDGECEEEEKP